jgi:hypothetical protein
MAGAVYAIREWMERERVRPFEYYYTAGGGALVGLLSLAPRSGDWRRALRDIVEFGVADPIYRLVPLGYKTFFKPGPFTEPLRRWADVVKASAGPRTVSLVSAWLELLGGSTGGRTWRSPAVDPQRRLFNDWVDFVAAALAPTPVGPNSQGLCAPAPFIDEVIDFDAVRRQCAHFYVNAFDLTDGRMRQFSGRDLTADHVRAAIAFPFIYPPVEIDGHLFAEGADHDPINLQGLPRLLEGERAREGVIVLVDILSQLSRYLLRPPRDLWDAYGMSIMTPVVELARKDIELFKERRGSKWPGFDLCELTFDIPEPAQPHLLEWSFSNMCTLWDVGYHAGVEFCDKQGRALQ